MIASDQANVKLRTYPKLSAKAIQQGLAGPMRLYDLVQSLAASRNGSPYFARADLVRLHLLSPQQIDRALRDGLGVFWTRTPVGDYHMTSRARLIVALEVEGKPGRAVWLPMEAFTGHLSNYKAASYAGYLAQLYQTTPRRSQLCETFGVSIPTLLEWERMTGVHVRPRLVWVDPSRLRGMTDDQGQMAAVWGEWQAKRSDRVWITLRGPRGGRIASRRLMDADNEPLYDFWRVLEEPAWEMNATSVLTWQTTNDYQSPLDLCASGRGSWLHAESRRISYRAEAQLDTPAINAMGGHADCADASQEPNQNSAELEQPKQDSSESEQSKQDSAEPERPEWETRPGWHHDEYKAIKWQGRKPNRHRPAIVQKVYKHRIMGYWLPSRAAELNEKELSKT